METRYDGSHVPAGPHFELRIPSEEAERILELMQDDELSLTRLTEEISQRGAIASIVLRSAASAGSGIREVRSLRHAVTILGFNRILTLLNGLRNPVNPDRSRVAG